MYQWLMYFECQPFCCWNEEHIGWNRKCHLFHHGNRNVHPTIRATGVTPNRVNVFALLEGGREGVGFGCSSPLTSGIVVSGSVLMAVSTYGAIVRNAQEAPLKQ